MKFYFIYGDIMLMFSILRGFYCIFYLKLKINLVMKIYSVSKFITKITNKKSVQEKLSRNFKKIEIEDFLIFPKSYTSNNEILLMFSK